MGKDEELPTWLAHKPIVSVKYDDGDARFLSLGRPTWDNEDFYSAKIWRKKGERWSRQSEEMPLYRLLDLALLLVSVFKGKNEFVNNDKNKNYQIQEGAAGDLEELIINIRKNDDLKFRLRKLKELLNSDTIIDSDSKNNK